LKDEVRAKQERLLLADFSSGITLGLSQGVADESRAREEWVRELEKEREIERALHQQEVRNDATESERVRE